MAPATDNPAADANESQEAKLEKAAPVEPSTTEPHDGVAANGATKNETADAEQAAAAAAADVRAGPAEEGANGDAGEKKPAAQDAPAANDDSTNADKTAADGHTGDRRDRDHHTNKSADRKDGGRRDDRDRSSHQRPKGRGAFKPKVNEFENLPETDDPDAIRDQVEFYFSAHNLSTDEHLFFQIDGPDNRTVPIKHIHSFKRMKRFQPYSAVVKALKDSEQLDVVEDGNFRGAGNEGVKRKIPLEIPGWDREKDPDATLEKLFDMLNQHSKNEMGRSIYAKGFGEEHNGQIELEDYFKAFGAVMVRKRRFPDTGEWKGSVFVEFDSEESQAAFLALDPKPKFHGLELEVMDKKAYSKMKCDQKGIIPNWERDNSARRKPRFSHHGHDRSRNHDRSRDEDRSRRARDEPRDDDRSSGRGNGRGRGGRGGRGQRGGNRGGNRGGRGGRRNDSRSRSPRGSGDEDRDDWKDRRNKFQNKGRWNNRDRDGKGHNKGRRDDRDRDGDRGEKDHGLNRDDGGVPGVADTRKRKVEDGEEKENGSKKAKVEISEDA